MNLISMSSASTIQYSPSKQYLGQISKNPDRPGYFIHDGLRWRIDIDNIEWLNLLAARQAKSEGTELIKIVSEKPKTKPKKKIELPENKNQQINPPPSSGDSENKLEDMVELQREKLRQEIQEKKTKNQMLFLDLRRNSKNIVDIDFGEYLWFTHIDRLHLDLMRIGKKIEPIVDNLVKENKTREIIKRFSNEIEMAIREAKKSQADDIKTWSDEMGIKK